MLGVVRSSSPRRRSPSRVLAGLVLALFAFGWLTDRAHSAFERHAWCEEHKRVEHHDASLASCAHADSHAASDDDRGPSIEPFDTDAAEHAACCVLLARSGDPVTVPNTRFELSWLLLGEALGCVPPTTRESVAPISLILLAPKQSPPTV